MAETSTGFPEISTELGSIASTEEEQSTTVGGVAALILITDISA